MHTQLVVSTIRPDVLVAVQNVYAEAKQGAWTGELTPDVVKDIGVNWTILGHSERRTLLTESSEFIAIKTKNALENGLKVLLCIGEKLEERENGTTMKVCASQLAPVFDIVKPHFFKDMVIAYEPVWAIGK